MNDELHKFLNEEYNLNKRIQAFEKRKFYNTEIELTDGCCLSCKYCYVSSKTIPTNNLEIEKAKELIDSLIDYGLTSFWWGGGEPLLNQNWSEILKYAKESGATENLIFTNGLFLNKQTCKDLCKLADRVTVHLDTIRANTFGKMQIHRNKIRQIHDKILKGIDNLLDSGFNNNMIRWNITLCKTILPDIESTLNYVIQKKRIRTVVLIPLFNTGRASSIYNDEKLSIKEIENAFTLRAKIENRPYLLSLGPSEFCKQYQLTSFAINAMGNVLPYVDYFTSAGNIYSENICNIITKNFDFLSFKALISTDTYKNKLHGKCGKCGDQKYCFGNPTMAANGRRHLWDSDPYCWKE